MLSLSADFVYVKRCYKRLPATYLRPTRVLGFYWQRYPQLGRRPAARACW